MPTALDVRETRSNAKAALRRLSQVVDEMDEATEVRNRVKVRRLRQWQKLRALDPPVSWADIARVSHVDPVTVIQAVNGRGGSSR